MKNGSTVNQPLPNIFRTRPKMTKHSKRDRRPTWPKGTSNSDLVDLCHPNNLGQLNPKIRHIVEKPPIVISRIGSPLEERGSKPRMGKNTSIKTAIGTVARLTV
jgi:hypothetical protein